MRNLVKITLMFLLFAFIFDANASFNVFQGQKEAKKTAIKVKKEYKNRYKKEENFRAIAKEQEPKNVNYNKQMADHLFGRTSSEGSK